MGNQSILKANGISKSFDKLTVLRELDLEVDSGQIVSIMGKSGSGKSTLLHIMSTLDHADQGTLIIDHTDISSLSKKALAAFRNQKIGFVFQFHHLLAEFTALENVTIPGLIQKRSKKEVERKAEELLEYLDLKERMEHKPNQMSGGEQQRVAFARALINDPKIIFADEPTGNLDTSTSEELHNLILQLQKDMNQTFIVATHNDDLAKLSNKNYILKDGKLMNQNQ